MHSENGSIVIELPLVNSIHEARLTRADVAGARGGSFENLHVKTEDIR